MPSSTRPWINAPMHHAPGRRGWPALGLVALCMTMACSGDDPASPTEPADLLAVSMTGIEGQPAPAAAPSARAATIPSSPPRSTHASNLPVDERWYEHARAEQGIRRWEREHLDPAVPGRPFAEVSAAWAAMQYLDGMRPIIRVVRTR